MRVVGHRRPTGRRWHRASITFDDSIVRQSSSTTSALSIRHSAAPTLDRRLDRPPVGRARPLVRRRYASRISSSPASAVARYNTWPPQLRRQAPPRRSLLPPRAPPRIKISRLPSSRSALQPNQAVDRAACPDASAPRRPAGRRRGSRSKRRRRSPKRYALALARARPAPRCRKPGRSKRPCHVGTDDQAVGGDGTVVRCHRRARRAHAADSAADSTPSLWPMWIS